MNSQERKNTPVFSGVMQYFPDALMAVAQHSKVGNDKHNPGQPLHWARGKSTDQADCIARHLIDIGPEWNLKDPETGSYHATALAWRALALLQLVIERDREKATESTKTHTCVCGRTDCIDVECPRCHFIKQSCEDIPCRCKDESERKEKWIAP